MALPPFDDRGLLPPTETGLPHPATLFEVRRRFVVEQDNLPWRRQLFTGWLRLALQVDRRCPGASWWLWGSFVSAHVEPMFGARATLTCLVILPYGDVADLADDQLGSLMRSLQRAEMDLREDVSWIVDLPVRHENYLRQRFALEKYRERAIRAPLDDDERLAGFVEVHP